MAIEIYDGTTAAKFDSSGSLSIVPVEQLRLHQGKMFCVNSTVAVTATTASAYRWSIKTPNTTGTYYANIRLQGARSWYGEIRQAATISAAGATITTAVNLNRNSANTTKLEFQEEGGTLTFSADGTFLQLIQHPSLANYDVFLPADDLNIVLKSNERYMLRVVAETNTSITMNCRWYEE